MSMEFLRKIWHHGIVFPGSLKVLADKKSNLPSFRIEVMANYEKKFYVFEHHLVLLQIHYYEEKGSINKSRLVLVSMADGETPAKSLNSLIICAWSK